MASPLGARGAKRSIVQTIKQMKKKILLLALTDNRLYESFEDNLRKNGFEPTLVLNEKYPFKYRSIWQRLDNFWRKTLLGDRQHKNKLRERYNQEQYLKAVQAQGAHDYCLVIRSDFFFDGRAKSRQKLFKTVCLLPLRRD